MQDVRRDWVYAVQRGGFKERADRKAEGQGRTNGGNASTMLTERPLDSLCTRTAPHSAAQGESSVRTRSESETRDSSVGPIAGRVMGGMGKLMRTVSRPGTAAARCSLSNPFLYTAV